MWEYLTASYDIEFNVKFLPKGMPAGAAFDVRPTVRVDSHKKQRIGAVITASAGVVQLIWDNGFSRFRNKTLKFRAHKLNGKVPNFGTIIEVKTQFGEGTLLECNLQKGTFTVDIGDADA